MEKKLTKGLDTTTDTELDTMADDIEAGKGSKRRHYAKRLGICVIPFVVTILGIYPPTYIKDFPGFLFAASALGIIPALLVALFFGGRNLGRIFFPLNPVEKAFQSLYKALRWKDPQKEKNTLPQFKRTLGGIFSTLPTSSINGEK